MQAVEHIKQARIRWKILFLAIGTVVDVKRHCLVLCTRNVEVEIGNYGPLTKQANGTFKAWTGRVIPASMVLDLGFVFRGYQYYHKLTDKQLVAIEQVIRYHAKNHNIKLDAGRVFTRADFNFDIPGAQNKAVAFHVNYRTDGEKQDLPPDPRLLDMLNRLHATT
jgi:hypothetical protein